MFRNYKDRGEQFKGEVKKLVESVKGKVSCHSDPPDGGEESLLKLKYEVYSFT